ncbi:MAG: hypothetical protein HZB44_10925 [Actinobacteria bacterium]|nr:hypothetical protein [Actinomycetota bacterium]
MIVSIHQKALLPVALNILPGKRRLAGASAGALTGASTGTRASFSHVFIVPFFPGRIGLAMLRIMKGSDGEI